ARGGSRAQLDRGAGDDPHHAGATVLPGRARGGLSPPGSHGVDPGARRLPRARRGPPLPGRRGAAIAPRCRGAGDVRALIAILLLAAAARADEGRVTVLSQATLSWSE